MAHVRDVWMKKGPNGRKVRSDRWGKGKRWQVRWIENGVEQSHMFGSKDAAEDKAAKLELGITGPSYTGMTVGEYAEVWLGNQLHYADSSRETARHRINGQILPAFGGRPMADVTRLEVQNVITAWSEDLAPNTVRLVVSFLRSIFGTAADDKLIRISPCVRVNLPPRSRRKIIPLTAEQVGRIAAAVDPRYRAMVIIAAQNGLRPGELAGLTVEQNVLGDLVIDRQLVDVLPGGAPVFGPPKSEASDRRIANGVLGRAALAEHLATYPPGPEGLIFTSRQGGALRRTRMGDIWRAATDGMGLRARTGWHEFRHYHASVLIHAGRSPKAVAERMGHADAAETLRTYAHLWPSDEADLVAILDAELAPYISVSASADHDSTRDLLRISPSQNGTERTETESQGNVRPLVRARFRP